MPQSRVPTQPGVMSHPGATTQPGGMSDSGSMAAADGMPLTGWFQLDQLIAATHKLQQGLQQVMAESAAEQVGVVGAH